MAERPLRILQVSTVDVLGGAEKVAWNLFKSYQARGNISSLAVGYKRSDDPDVRVIPNLGDQRSKTFARVIRYASGRFKRILDRYGVEDFHFPGSRRLLDLNSERPHIVHCHNLHGAYFDLRVLPDLSRQVPVVMTLHDAWLLSGHCGHSFDCERWKLGCGKCPDLSIYPAIRRDATAYNWRRKQGIYRRSRIFVAAPSKWLMRKVEQSILAPAIVESRVIPNGVDLSSFRPGKRSDARTLLKIAPETRVVLFAGHGIRHNIWKDYRTMQAAIEQVAAELNGHNLLFIALGEDAPPERIGRAQVHFVPYQKDPDAVARYYRAADVYLHAAKADTFPNSVLEALACGIPVVATRVGGIPEQVKPLRGFGGGTSDESGYGVNDATGILVLLGDVREMARAIARLLTDDCLRQRMGRNAASDARQRFDIERQVDEYLTWYQQLMQRARGRITESHLRDLARL